jgi:hypothetical protein
MWLRDKLGLAVPPPAVRSFLTATARRRTEVRDDFVLEWYPASFAPDESDVRSHLRFALRHEPIDLGVLVATFATPGIERTIEDWVRAEPTGRYARRVWFLFESVTAQRVPLPDAAAGNYVAALDPEQHYVGPSRRSQRHRVLDNLFGGPNLCVTVRRTARLEQFMALGLDRKAADLAESCDPGTLARAVHYLHTKETRSSFAIEREQPSPKRQERFVAALRAANGPGAASVDLARVISYPTAAIADEVKAALIRLQHIIVDARYAAKDWRDFETYIGGVQGAYLEDDVHYICPHYGAVPSLMLGWIDLLRQLLAPAVDPVVAAAVGAFAFVFIHPFEDGNGRIHRFLIHRLLAHRGFTPKEILFPISAAILRKQRAYDEVLSSYSAPLMSLVDWEWVPTGASGEKPQEKTVRFKEDVAHLYRYFDATKFVEFLYECIEETIRIDLSTELEFIAVFDEACLLVREIVDLPDRRLHVFVKACLQNDGRLSKAKRRLFEDLTDAEVHQMEAAVAQARTPSVDDDNASSAPLTPPPAAPRCPDRS